jgi:hypothetical protein
MESAGVDTGDKMLVGLSAGAADADVDAERRATVSMATSFRAPHRLRVGSR